MSKLIQKISAPGSMHLATGTRNATGGAHGGGGALAKVKQVGTAGSGGTSQPVQKPIAGIQGKKIGQPNPNTSAAATKKPNRNGGAAFYGDY